MIIRNVIVCVVIIVVQIHGLVQLRSSLASSDNPLLTKILQSIDAATSDEHLFEVTLKLLKSLCACMRETLKAKEDRYNSDKSLMGLSKSINTEGKVIDLYKKIYNNTCFNLKQVLSKRNNKSNETFNKSNETWNNSNCGKDYDQKPSSKQENEAASQMVKHVLQSKLDHILYRALVQTRHHHKYIIKKYNLFGKAKSRVKISPKHTLIVILTLHPDKKDLRKYNVVEEDLHKILHKNSTIEIDIIDTRYDQKESEEAAKTAIYSDCHLQSLYTYLTESEKKNLTKVFRYLRRRDTIKIYIEVFTGSNHTDYINICCENGVMTALCKKGLIESLNSQEDVPVQYKKLDKEKSVALHNDFKNTISKLKNLVKKLHYKSSGRTTNNLKLNFTNNTSKSGMPHVAIEGMSIMKENSSITGQYRPKTNSQPNLEGNLTHPMKLRDVSRAIILLNDFVSKQTTMKNNTKPHKKTNQTDYTHTDITTTLDFTEAPITQKETIATDSSVIVDDNSTITATEIYSLQNTNTRLVPRQDTHKLNENNTSQIKDTTRLLPLLRTINNDPSISTSLTPSRSTITKNITLDLVSTDMESEIITNAITTETTMNLFNISQPKTTMINYLQKKYPSGSSKLSISNLTSLNHDIIENENTSTTEIFKKIFHISSIKPRTLYIPEKFDYIQTKVQHKERNKIKFKNEKTTIVSQPAETNLQTTNDLNHNTTILIAKVNRTNTKSVIIPVQNVLKETTSSNFSDIQHESKLNSTLTFTTNTFTDMPHISKNDTKSRLKQLEQSQNNTKFIPTSFSTSQSMKDLIKKDAEALILLENQEKRKHTTQMTIELITQSSSPMSTTKAYLKETEGLFKIKTSDATKTTLNSSLYNSRSQTESTEELSVQVLVNSSTLPTQKLKDKQATDYFYNFSDQDKQKNNFTTKMSTSETYLKETQGSNKIKTFDATKINLNSNLYNSHSQKENTDKPSVPDFITSSTLRKPKLKDEKETDSYILSNQDKQEINSTVDFTTQKMQSYSAPLTGTYATEKATESEKLLWNLPKIPTKLDNDVSQNILPSDTSTFLTPYENTRVMTDQNFSNMLTLYLPSEIAAAPLSTFITTKKYKSPEYDSLIHSTTINNDILDNKLPHSDEILTAYTDSPRMQTYKKNWDPLINLTDINNQDTVTINKGHDVMKIDSTQNKNDIMLDNSIESPYTGGDSSLINPILERDFEAKYITVTSSPFIIPAVISLDVPTKPSVSSDSIDNYRYTSIIKNHEPDFYVDTTTDTSSTRKGIQKREQNREFTIITPLYNLINNSNESSYLKLKNDLSNKITRLLDHITPTKTATITISNRDNNSRLQTTKSYDYNEIEPDTDSQMSAPSNHQLISDNLNIMTTEKNQNLAKTILTPGETKVTNTTITALQTRNYREAYENTVQFQKSLITPIIYTAAHTKDAMLKNNHQLYESENRSENITTGIKSIFTSTTTKNDIFSIGLLTDIDRSNINSIINFVSENERKDSITHRNPLPIKSKRILTNSMKNTSSITLDPHLQESYIFKETESLKPTIGETVFTSSNSNENNLHFTKDIENKVDRSKIQDIITNSGFIQKNMTNTKYSSLKNTPLDNEETIFIDPHFQESHIIDETGSLKPTIGETVFTSPNTDENNMHFTKDIENIVNISKIQDLSTNTGIIQKHTKYDSVKDTLMDNKETIFTDLYNFDDIVHDTRSEKINSTFVLTNARFDRNNEYNINDTKPTENASRISNTTTNPPSLLDNFIEISENTTKYIDHSNTTKHPTLEEPFMGENIDGIGNIRTHPTHEVTNDNMSLEEMNSTVNHKNDIANIAMTKEAQGKVINSFSLNKYIIDDIPPNSTDAMFENVNKFGSTKNSTVNTISKPPNDEKHSYLNFTKQMEHNIIVDENNTNNIQNKITSSVFPPENLAIIIYSTTYAVPETKEAISEKRHNFHETENTTYKINFRDNIVKTQKGPKSITESFLNQDHNIVTTASSLKYAAPNTKYIISPNNQTYAMMLNFTKQVEYNNIVDENIRNNMQDKITNSVFPRENLAKTSYSTTYTVPKTKKDMAETLNFHETENTANTIYFLENIVKTQKGPISTISFLNPGHNIVTTDSSLKYALPNAKHAKPPNNQKYSTVLNFTKQVEHNTIVGENMRNNIQDNITNSVFSRENHTKTLYSTTYTVPKTTEIMTEKSHHFHESKNTANNNNFLENVVQTQKRSKSITKSFLHQNHNIATTDSSLKYAPPNTKGIKPPNTQKYSMNLNFTKQMEKNIFADENSTKNIQDKITNSVFPRENRAKTLHSTTYTVPETTEAMTKKAHNFHETEKLNTAYKINFLDNIIKTQKGPNSITESFLNQEQNIVTTDSSFKYTPLIIKDTMFSELHVLKDTKNILNNTTTEVNNNTISVNKVNTKGEEIQDTTTNLTIQQKYITKPPINVVNYTLPNASTTMFDENSVFNSTSKVTTNELFLRETKLTGNNNNIANTSEIQEVALYTTILRSKNISTSSLPHIKITGSKEIENFKVNTTLKPTSTEIFSTHLYNTKNSTYELDGIKNIKHAQEITHNMTANSKYLQNNDAEITDGFIKNTELNTKEPLPEKSHNIVDKENIIFNRIAKTDPMNIIDRTIDDKEVLNNEMDYTASNTKRPVHLKSISSDITPYDAFVNTVYSDLVSPNKQNIDITKHNLWASNIAVSESTTPIFTKGITINEIKATFNNNFSSTEQEQFLNYIPLVTFLSSGNIENTMVTVKKSFKSMSTSAPILLARATLKMNEVVGLKNTHSINTLKASKPQSPLLKLRDKINLLTAKPKIFTQDNKAISILTPATIPKDERNFKHFSKGNTKKIKLFKLTSTDTAKRDHTQTLNMPNKFKHKATLRTDNLHENLIENHVTSKANHAHIFGNKKLSTVTKPYTTKMTVQPYEKSNNDRNQSFTSNILFSKHVITKSKPQYIAHKKEISKYDDPSKGHNIANHFSIMYAKTGNMTTKKAFHKSTKINDAMVTTKTNRVTNFTPYNLTTVEPEQFQLNIRVGIETTKDKVQFSLVSINEKPENMSQPVVSKLTKEFSTQSPVIPTSINQIKFTNFSAEKRNYGLNNDFLTRLNFTRRFNRKKDLIGTTTLSKNFKQFNAKHQLPKATSHKWKQVTLTSHPKNKVNSKNIDKNASDVTTKMPTYSYNDNKLKVTKPTFSKDKQTLNMHDTVQPIKRKHKKIVINPASFTDQFSMETLKTMYQEHLQQLKAKNKVIEKDDSTDKNISNIGFTGSIKPSTVNQTEVQHSVDSKDLLLLPQNVSTSVFIPQNGQKTKNKVPLSVIKNEIIYNTTQILNNTEKNINNLKPRNETLINNSLVLFGNNSFEHCKNCTAFEDYNHDLDKKKNATTSVVVVQDQKPLNSSTMPQAISNTSSTTILIVDLIVINNSTENTTSSSYSLITAGNDKPRSYNESFYNVTLNVIKTENIKQNISSEYNNSTINPINMQNETIYNSTEQNKLTKITNLTNSEKSSMTLGVTKAFKRKMKKYTKRKKSLAKKRKKLINVLKNKPKIANILRKLIKTKKLDTGKLNVTDKKRVLNRLLSKLRRPTAHVNVTRSHHKANTVPINSSTRDSPVKYNTQIDKPTRKSYAHSAPGREIEWGLERKISQHMLFLQPSGITPTKESSNTKSLNKLVTVNSKYSVPDTLTLELVRRSDQNISWGVKSNDKNELAYTTKSYRYMYKLQKNITRSIPASTFEQIGIGDKIITKLVTLKPITSNKNPTTIMNSLTIRPISTSIKQIHKRTENINRNIIGTDYKPHFQLNTSTTGIMKPQNKKRYVTINISIPYLTLHAAVTTKNVDNAFHKRLKNINTKQQLETPMAKVKTKELSINSPSTTKVNLVLNSTMQTNKSFTSPLHDFSPIVSEKNTDIFNISEALSDIQENSNNLFSSEEMKRNIKFINEYTTSNDKKPKTVSNIINNSPHLRRYVGVHTKTRSPKQIVEKGTPNIYNKLTGVANNKLTQFSKPISIANYYSTIPNISVVENVSNFAITTSNENDLMSYSNQKNNLKPISNDINKTITEEHYTTDVTVVRRHTPNYSKITSILIQKNNLIMPSDHVSTKNLNHLQSSVDTKYSLDIKDNSTSFNSINVTMPYDHVSTTIATEKLNQLESSVDTKYSSDIGDNSTSFNSINLIVPEDHVSTTIATKNLNQLQSTVDTKYSSDTENNSTSFNLMNMIIPDDHVSITKLQSSVGTKYSSDIEDNSTSFNSINVTMPYDHVSTKNLNQVESSVDTKYSSDIEDNSTSFNSINLIIPEDRVSSTIATKNLNRLQSSVDTNYSSDIKDTVNSINLIMSDDHVNTTQFQSSIDTKYSSDIGDYSTSFNSTNLTKPEDHISTTIATKNLNHLQSSVDTKYSSDIENNSTSFNSINLIMPSGHVSAKNLKQLQSTVDTKYSSIIENNSTSFNSINVIIPDDHVSTTKLQSSVDTKYSSDIGDNSTSFNSINLIVPEDHISTTKLESSVDSKYSSDMGDNSTSFNLIIPEDQVGTTITTKNLNRLQSSVDTKYTSDIEDNSTLLIKKLNNTGGSKTEMFTKMLHENILTSTDYSNKITILDNISKKRNTKISYKMSSMPNDNVILGTSNYDDHIITTHRPKLENQSDRLSITGNISYDNMHTTIVNESEGTNNTYNNSQLKNESNYEGDAKNNYSEIKTEIYSSLRPIVTSNATKDITNHPRKEILVTTKITKENTQIMSNAVNDMSKHGFRYTTQSLYRNKEKTNTRDHYKISDNVTNILDENKVPLSTNTEHLKPLHSLTSINTSPITIALDSIQFGTTTSQPFDTVDGGLLSNTQSLLSYTTQKYHDILKEKDITSSITPFKINKHQTYPIKNSSKTVPPNTTPNAFTNIGIKQNSLVIEVLKNNTIKQNAIAAPNITKQVDNLTEKSLFATLNESAVNMTDKPTFITFYEVVTKTSIEKSIHSLITESKTDANAQHTLSEVSSKLSIINNTAKTDVDNRIQSLIKSETDPSWVSLKQRNHDNKISNLPSTTTEVIPNNMKKIHDYTSHIHIQPLSTISKNHIISQIYILDPQSSQSIWSRHAKEKKIKNGNLSKDNKTDNNNSSNINPLSKQNAEFVTVEPSKEKATPGVSVTMVSRNSELNIKDNQNEMKLTVIPKLNPKTLKTTDPLNWTNNLQRKKILKDFYIKNSQNKINQKRLKIPNFNFPNGLEGSSLYTPRSPEYTISEKHKDNNEFNTSTVEQSKLLLPTPFKQVTDAKSISTVNIRNNALEYIFTKYKNLIDSKSMEGKNLKIYSSRLNRQHYLRLPSHLVTKKIKYNTYQPPIKEDFEGPKRNRKLSPRPNTSCAILKTLRHKFNSALEFRQFLKASNCTTDNLNIHFNIKNNRFKHLPIKVNENKKMNKQLTQNKHPNMVLTKKVYSKLGSRESLLSSYEKTKLFPVKAVKALPPIIPPVVVKRINIGRRKEIMTMNTHDFFSQHQLATPGHFNNNIKQRPYKLYFRPVATSNPRQVLRPKFDTLESAWPNVDKPRTFFLPPINSEVVFPDSYEVRYIDKMANRKHKMSTVAAIQKQMGRVVNVLDRPRTKTIADWQPNIFKDSIDSDKRKLWGPPEFVKLTRPLTVRQPVTPSGDLSNPLQIQYRRNNDYVTPITNLVTSNPMGRTRRRRRTIFFLSPTGSYSFEHFI